MIYIGKHRFTTHMNHRISLVGSIEIYFCCELNGVEIRLWFFVRFPKLSSKFFYLKYQESYSYKVKPPKTVKTVSNFHPERWQLMWDFQNCLWNFSSSNIKTVTWPNVELNILQSRVLSIFECSSSDGRSIIATTSSKIKEVTKPNVELNN